MEELPRAMCCAPGCRDALPEKKLIPWPLYLKKRWKEIQNHKNLSLQIFATDLDPDAIEIARKGIFSSNITVDVSPERLSKFFTVEPDRFPA